MGMLGYVRFYLRRILGHQENGREIPRTIRVLRRHSGECGVVGGVV
jgi:hypothetical protein